MKQEKVAIALTMLLGSSSVVLGCTVHGGASVNVPPPPTATLVVQGNTDVQAQGTVQTELVVQGPPPAPPPPQVEVVPASPGVEFFWVGGYHRWDGHAYVWTGGRYEHRPHAGAQWHAAHWEPRGGGHVWIEGNWDGQATVVATAQPQPQPQPVAVQAQTEVVVEGEPPPQPAPQVETVPASPGAEFFWVGGYHRYDGPSHHYIWTPGRYEHRPHAGAQWKAAHWEPRGHQHVWVEGNWDANVNVNANASATGSMGGGAPGAAPGGAPGGTHPGYLHALSDLRNARANLERKGGDKQMKWDEKDAIGAIDRAIKDIKEASLDDGKNLADHPAVDAKERRSGRLHKALDALHAAHGDTDKEEDNAFAKGLRARASHDIEEAIRFTEAGIQAAAAVE
jgi:hypothetical protein